MNRRTSRHTHGARRLAPLALAAVLALGATPAQPAYSIYYGSKLGYWDTPSAWSYNAEPGVDDDAILNGWNAIVRTHVTIKSFRGTGELVLTSRGSLSFAEASTIGSLKVIGGFMSGAGDLVVSKASTWTGGQMDRAGSTTFKSGVTLNGLVPWLGNGTIALGNGAVLTNNGTFEDWNTGAASLAKGSGSGSSFNNVGSYLKAGYGTTTISTAFNNSGSLVVRGSKLNLNGGISGLGSVAIQGGVVNIVGDSSSMGDVILYGDLSASGELRVSEASSWGSGTMSGLIRFDKGLTIHGLGHALDKGSLWLKGSSDWTAGDITLSNGAQFNNSGNLTDTSVGRHINVSGTGSNGFFNDGTYTRGNIGTTTVDADFFNTGMLTVSKGTMQLNRGINSHEGVPLQGTLGGKISVASGATLVLGADSLTLDISIAGTAPDMLTLGANHLLVMGDYNNANFGVGNAFNRRNGVSGTGEIRALGVGTHNALQTLSGPRIHMVDPAHAVLTLPNMRVGGAPVLTSFKINNAGDAGPSLRGAIQTAGITTATLSGSGVTAQNWGPLAFGASSGIYDITYAPKTAGNALAGQSLVIVNNFDNVAGQTLTFSGGKVYAPAVAQMDSNTLNFGIVHVGDTVGRGITVRNGAAVAGLNDVLVGTASSGGSAFTVGGSLAGVLAGAQDGSSLKVGLNTSQAGVFGGTATLAFASHNADMSDLALAGQQVGLSAQVNNYAQLGLSKLSGAGSFAASGLNSYTLNFGSLTLGDGTLSAELMAGNVALGLADMLGLQFELGTASQHFTLNGFGPISGLGAGASQGGLQISFSGLLAGRFDEVIMLHATGSNASGYAGALPDVQLHLRGEVVAVPEPASWAQFGLGLIGMMGFMVRRRLGQARWISADRAQP